MNIITTSDVKKFLALLKAGLKNGRSKELKTYSSATKHDGIDVAKEYYIHLEFSFSINPDDIDKIISEDLMDNDIDDLLNKI